MATKTKKVRHTKRLGLHHKHGKDYKQVYWPYLPLLGLSFVLLLASFMPTRPNNNQGSTLAYASHLDTKSLLHDTNKQRLTNSKGDLALNEQLNQAAQAKASDMAKRDYWSHQTPEGQDPWIFIDQTNYDYIRAGENLAYGFRDSEATVDGWMKSPTHRDNLLDEDFTDVGFGFANVEKFQDEEEVTLVVAMYGRPTALGITEGSSNSNTVAGLAESKTVTRAESLLDLPSASAGLFIGSLASLSIAGLSLNHGLRLRKLLLKGEQYFVAHPLLDLALIMLAAAAFNFSKVVAYVH